MYSISLIRCFVLIVNWCLTPFLQIAIILFAAMLCGCVSASKLHAFHASHSEREKFVDVALKKNTEGWSPRESGDLYEVNKPYLAGKSIPLARDLRLPRPLQKGVSTILLFNEKRVSLATAAERISMATGIPVVISHDVYIEPEQLMPKSLKAAANVGMGQVMPLTGSWPSNSGLVASPSSPFQNLMPTQHNLVGLSSSGTLQHPHAFEMPMMHAPLAQILDLIAARLNIRWIFDEQEQHIRFHRLQTKTWHTPFSPSELSFSTQFDTSSSSSSNANGVQIRPATFPLKHEASKLNELHSLASTVESLMTKAGTLHVNQTSGTLTVTDTPEVIAAADRLVESEIAILSKVVTLKVRTIQVKTDDRQLAGLDLSVAIQKIVNGLPQFNATLTSPTSTLPNYVGQLGINLLSGQANGSAALIKALSKLGEVHTSTELTLPTRNRKPVSYNVTKTFSYVAATTPATASLAGSGGVPGINTAQDQVGLKLMFFPNVTTKDTVMLTMSLEQSLLENIEPFSSGTGQNVQTVQLPNKAAENSSGEIPLRHGQTIVLTGLDKRSDQFDRRKLGEGIASVLGGSQSLQSERSTTIVLITAYVNTWE